MRLRQNALSRGALPPAFGSPRDTLAKMKEMRGPFIFAANIPAGGNALFPPHHAADEGAQNSFCKNFAGRRARR
jgi:hypothetical protein